MGQSFFLSLYDEKQNKYASIHSMYYKLGEWAYNGLYWGYIKNNPLRVGYLADKDGTTFFLRKNMGIWKTQICPAKIRFVIEDTDTHITCTTAFIPDDGVTLVQEAEDDVTFADALGNKFTDYKTEWFGSACILRSSCNPQNKA